MRPERPSRLTFASSDGYVDWEQFRAATMEYFQSSEDDDLEIVDMAAIKVTTGETK